MLVLFLKILLSHLIGDFLLQPNNWVKDKQKKKHKSIYLYLHIFIHAIVLYCLLQFDNRYLLGIATIAISHFLIDLTKLNLNKKFNSRLLFFADQLAHLLIIVSIVNAYQPINIGFNTILSTKNILLVIALIGVTSVSSIVMKVIITKWSLEEEPNNNSLKDAGKYIGILERLFVFVFIITNHWQAIGFLLAAKSVFRFGDLSKSKDRKLTEYILIGTLISFGLALLIGLSYIYTLKQLNL